MPTTAENLITGSKRMRRSAEEQIDHLQERAFALEVKTTYIRLCAKLRKNPTILQLTEKHVDTLIRTAANTGQRLEPKADTESIQAAADGVAAAASPCSLFVSPKASDRMAFPVEPQLDADDEDEDYDDSSTRASFSPRSSAMMAGAVDGDVGGTSSGEMLPGIFPSIGCCTVHWLKPMMRAIEDISFSPLSLRYLLEANKREIKKPVLLEIVEFSTDVSPDQPLEGRDRIITNLHARLKSLSERRGRVGRDSKLPPDWSKVGYYYLLDLNTSQPKVVHRYFGVTRPLPTVRFEGGGHEWKTARVDLPFSESRASVGTSKAFKLVMLRTLFEDLIDKPPCIRTLHLDVETKPSHLPLPELKCETKAITHKTGFTATKFASPCFEALAPPPPPEVPAGMETHAVATKAVEKMGGLAVLFKPKLVAPALLAESLPLTPKDETSEAVAEDEMPPPKKSKMGKKVAGAPKTGGCKPAKAKAK